MILKEKDKRKIDNEILSIIKSLKLKYNSGFSDKIIGLNYLLANVYALKEMNGSEILDNEDYYKNEDGSDVKFSRKFLSKRLKSFHSLLWHANNFDSSKLENCLVKQESELNNFFLEIESDGRNKWINKSGFYSFYTMIREGYVTYGEFGEDVEKLFID